MQISSRRHFQLANIANYNKEMHQSETIFFRKIPYLKKLYFVLLFSMSTELSRPFPYDVTHFGAYEPIKKQV